MYRFKHWRHTTLRDPSSVIPAGKRVSSAMEGITHIPVPGFLPPCRNDERHKEYQVILREIRLSEYSQLTDVQRYQIEALKKAEKDQKTIASIIGVSASRISRELKRIIQDNEATALNRPISRRSREEAAKVIEMTVGVINHHD